MLQWTHIQRNEASGVCRDCGIFQRTLHPLTTETNRIKLICEKAIHENSSSDLWIVAAVHLFRLIFYFTVVIGGFMVPLWVNVIALLIAAPLAVMLWREAK